MKKSIVFLLMLLLCLSGCGKRAEEGGKADDAALEKGPEKIVVLTAADCEVVYALGAGGRVIARGDYCDWPEQVLDVPSVSSGYETNIEEIIALKPDLVLMGKMDQKPEVADKLTEVGIKVSVSKADTIDETYEMISRIADALGGDAPEKGEELIASMKATFDEASKDSSGAGKTVYFEVSPLEYGLWTAGAGTFMNEAAEMVGLKNIFSDVEGWAEISEEQVIERDPDYIVTISMYYGEGPTPVEEILGRKGWENVSAIRSEAILNLTGNELSRPAPRLADGVKMLDDFVKAYE